MEGLIKKGGVLHQGFENCRETESPQRRRAPIKGGGKGAWEVIGKDGNSQGNS